MKKGTAMKTTFFLDLAASGLSPGCENIKPKLKRATLILLLPLLVAGCAAVKPWERGTLADYTMRSDRDPLGDALTEHMYFSREAASGGRGVGGGGCGCN
jgi:hypothetical protein